MSTAISRRLAALEQRRPTTGAVPSIVYRDDEDGRAWICIGSIDGAATIALPHNGREPLPGVPSHA